MAVHLALKRLRQLRKRVRQQLDRMRKRARQRRQRVWKALSRPPGDWADGLDSGRCRCPVCRAGRD
jgi:hypothetical protein